MTGAPSADPPILTIRHLTKFYRAGEVEVQALRGLCLAAAGDGFWHLWHLA